MRKFLWAIVLVLAILAIGIGIGWWVTRSNPNETKVTSQAILLALRDRGFLVTQTSVVNQTVKIANKQDTFWNRLLWGQVISATGVVEVNTGVDLSKLTDADVQVGAGKVTVYIPSTTVFDARVVGDINLDNSQGILKRLFENSDGYNEATAELVKEAESAAQSPDQLKVSSQKSVDEITRLVGYIAKDKLVEVRVR